MMSNLAVCELVGCGLKTMGAYNNIMKLLSFFWVELCSVIFCDLDLLWCSMHCKKYSKNPTLRR